MKSCYTNNFKIIIFFPNIHIDISSTKEVSFNELEQGQAFQMRRTGETVWIKDDESSTILGGNAYEHDNKDHRVHVNSRKTVQRMIYASDKNQ